MIPTTTFPAHAPSMFRRTLCAAAALFFGSVCGAQSFQVRLADSLCDKPVSGRILLMLSRTERLSPGENGTPLFGVTVKDLAPGEFASIDASSLGHPVRNLLDIPAGEYYVQAYLHVYTRFRRADGHEVMLPMDQGEGQKWRRSPGNHKSSLAQVNWDPTSHAPIEILLTETIPPLPPKEDTEWVKHVRIESPLLSKFWGTPMPIGASVLLPAGYHDEPDRRYPVVYMQGHFSSRPPMGFGRGRAFDEYWKSGKAPKVLLVNFQHANPYYDDSYGVNSENLGPYGDAMVTELIPELERRFQAIGEPQARVLTGGSTGGWIAVGMQVLYPDFFGGCWSFYPDQLDFRNYQVVDILEDDNAYFIEHEWSRVARPGNRRTDGNIVYTMEQENLYEEVIGTRYRSGGQWAIWNALFAPVADDGYPQPLWDPLTGEIDHEVARWARENYDLRHILERDWATLGPKLVGKLHVYVGRMDNYYLEGGVYRLHSFLESTRSPHYEGTVEYGDRGGHGWSPFRENELLETMAEHMNPEHTGS
ncbi:MAG: enterochelin esterase-like enzyme [Candidatus Paceibacteria bacterium]|jgi:enterochelin esterase-like enzyme